MPLGESSVKKILEEEILMSADESSHDDGGTFLKSNQDSTGIQFAPSQQPANRKRRDRLGNVINTGVQKRWQVTYRDNMVKGQPIATVFIVESYKEFNKLEDDPYAEGFDAHFKMLR
jgi:hypothetical protein